MTDPVTINVGDPVLAENFDAYEALTAAWTSYSPSWTASVNPAIGDGTITAHYIQVGLFVVYKGQINMGSTTTFGTGTWNISLPVTGANSPRGLGFISCVDSSTPANNRTGAANVGGGLTSFNMEAPGGNVSSTVPFTWASGDTLRWFMVYQASP